MRLDDVISPSTALKTQILDNFQSIESISELCNMQQDK